MTHQGLKILHFFLSLRSDLDVWDLLLAFVVILYLIVCPYTKVEESFNIQAIHDMLFHGTQLDKVNYVMKYDLRSMYLTLKICGMSYLCVNYDVLWLLVRSS